MKKIYLVQSRLKTKIVALVFLGFCSLAFSQEKKITGTVVDDNGIPLLGVNIVVQGKNVGTVTDFDGNYEVSVVEGDTMTFSAVGYKSNQVTVGDQEIINVTLTEDLTSLEEVVVIGYGTQKRKEVSGAVESVKQETILKTGNTDIGTALQGQIAGVNVTASSGQPGSNAVILIRGVNSVFGSNEPLFVVDGIVQQDNPQLSPYEIESIDVIKDAASAAVYGTRGSNGVILITTKRGREGRMQVDLNSFYGVQKILSDVPLLNTEEILYVDFARSNNINNDAFINNTFTALELNPFGLTNSTDLKDIVQNDYAPIHQHNLNISAGKQGLNYNLSTTYFNQEGVLINSGLERLNVRLNTTFEKGPLKVSSRVNLITDKQDLAPFNILLSGYRYRPYFAEVDLSPGDVNNIGASSDNNDAVALGQFARTLRRTNVREADDFNFNVEAQLKLFDGLTFTSRANLGRRNVLQTSIDPLFQVFTDDGEQVVLNPLSGSTVDNTRRRVFALENFLTYDKYFGDHHITATALVSLEEATSTFVRADGREFLNDVVTNLGGTVGESLVDGNENSNSLNSYLGRLQYGYKGKYLLSALVRVDGSSRFSSENRYVPLPSASAAWIVSEEPTWEDIMGSTFNFFKVRFSYGTVGNQFLGNYDFQPVINIDRDAIFGSGADETLSIGQIQAGFANPDLVWERKVESNFGIEMGFFESRLNFSADVYDGSRNDMLFDVIIPPSVGADDSNVRLNIGDMRNYGIEFALNYRHDGEFSFNIGATYAENENIITRMSETNTFSFLDSEIAPGLGGPIDDDVTAIREGFEAGAFFLFETDGIVTNEAELDEYQNRFAQTQNAQLGDLRYVDQLTEDTNGDGIPDAGNGILGIEDRVYKGSGAPEYEIGLNFNADYKGFDLAMQWYGAFGGEILNGSKSFAYRAGTHKDLLNAWTPTNNTSTIPSDRGRDSDNYRGYSDLWLEDATFIRLRNIQIGYTFPSNWIDKLGMTRARIYVAADNPITITDYTGFNPEAGAFDQFNANSNGLNRRGIDSGNYPVSSQIRGGIQITF